MIQLPTQIDTFSGSWNFLSNFYPCLVVLDGIEYSSLEHSYQASKTTNLKRREVFQLPGLTAGQAKRLGAKIPLRPDWEEVKVQVMRDLLKQKFYPTILRRKLLCTFNATLIEGNYWHDEFWGICDGKCRSGPHEPSGKNMLGVLLMETREHFGGAKRLEPSAGLL